MVLREELILAFRASARGYDAAGLRGERMNVYAGADGVRRIEAARLRSMI
jgi:hypothetical protein